jgi:hypothetical protein
MFLFFLVLRVPGSDVCLGSTLFCTGVVLSTWILMFLFFLVLREPGSDVLDQLYFSLMQYNLERQNNTNKKSGIANTFPLG